MPSGPGALLALALAGLLTGVVSGAPCGLSEQGLLTFCSAVYTVCLDEANSATPPAALGVNLLQCYCDMEACFEPLEEPICDEAAALLNQAQLRADEEYGITPVTCRGMIDFPPVDEIFGASNCSSADVAVYLECTEGFDECIQDAGLSRSPSAFLRMEASQYKAYAQCYCDNGLTCTSSITCQALSDRLAASEPELPPGVSCGNVEAAPASAFEVLLKDTQLVDPASVPPAASATCATQLELCRIDLAECAGAKGQFLDTSNLQAITTVPDDTEICFCDFFTCRSSTSETCQRTAIGAVARLQAAVGDCSRFTSNAWAPLKSTFLFPTLMVAVTASTLLALPV